MSRFIVHFVLVLGAFAASVTGICQAGDQIYTVAPYVAPDNETRSARVGGLDQRLKGAPKGAYRSVLGRPVVPKDAMLSSPGMPNRIGFSRAVSDLDSNTKTSATLNWTSVSQGGLSTQLLVESPTAEAVRLGLIVEALPNEAELRFFSPDGKEVKATDGRAINATLEENRTAGAIGSEAQRYWSPIIQGSVIGLEIFLPQGISPEGVRIKVPEIAHLVVSPVATEKALAARAGSASCELDVNCYPQWSSAKNSVARIVFSCGGGYQCLCTGTLLNTTTNSGVPYFLTANHCMNNQLMASSIESYWFYYSTACNSGQLNPGYVALPGGGTLLYHSDSTDAAFVQLKGPVPAGVTFSGWTNAAPNLGQSSTGLHNPRGDLQKISFGAIDSFQNCSAAGNSTFSCRTGTQNNSNFIDVVFGQGVTEEGSSGSGLFLNSGQLIGQLYGGDSSCSNPSGSNVYGRFDQTFAQGNLGQWLAPVGSQTITFGSAPALFVKGTATIQVSASSGLAVTLTSLTPKICSVSDLTVRGLKQGTCSVQASQAGGNGWQAAQPVSQSFSVTIGRRLTTKIQGTGVVLMQPSDTICTGNCTNTFQTGSRMQLSAKTGSFVRWKGIAGCNKAPICIFNLSGNKTVTAVFQ